MNFYVGQKVICIEDYVSELVLIKKDSIHVISDIKVCCCKKNNIALHFGKTGYMYSVCNICKYECPKDKFYFSSIYFRPIESFGDEIATELEKVINKEQEMFLTI